MSNFTWESEELWEDEIKVEKPPSPKRPWRLYLLIFVIVVGLISSLAGIAYWRINTVNQEVSQDVLSSHALLQEANSLKDRELFIGVLSGRNDAWVNTQLILFDQFQVDDRTLFGYENGENVPRESSLVVELDPELTSAELSQLQTYQDPFGNLIDLRLTYVYRLGQTRWLMAPPDDDFWGEWVEFQEPTAVVDTKFPDRDAPYVWQIQSYVDEKIQELCVLDGYNCTDDFSVKIIFHPDPYTIVQWSDPEYRYLYEEQIVVPSPTLIGIPTDETGLESISRSYAALILPKVIVDLVGYECCVEQFPLVESFIQRQLVELDILPDSDLQANAIEYFSDPFVPTSTLYDDGVEDDLSALSDRVTLLMDFYMARAGVSPPDILQAAVDRGDGWINLMNELISRPEEEPISVQQELVEFVQQTKDHGVMAGPLNQNVGMVCQANDRSVVYMSYDPQSDVWDQMNMNRLGMVSHVQTLLGEGFTWIENNNDIYRIFDEEPSLLYEGEPTQTINSFNTGNSPRVINYFSYTDQSNDFPSTMSLFSSVGDCVSEECRLRSMDDSIIFWSPNGIYGAQLSNLSIETPDLAIIDQQGNFIDGIEAFLFGGFWWLNDDSFLLTRQVDDPNNMDVFVVSVDDLSVKTRLFSWSELVESSMGSDQPTAFFPAWFIAIPNKPDQLGVLLSSSNPAVNDYRFVVYDFELGETLLEIEMDNYAEPVIDPLNRYLIVHSTQPMASLYRGAIIDLESLSKVDGLLFPKRTPRPETGTISIPGRFNWSADGQWLLQLNIGYFSVVNPATGESMFVSYPENVFDCPGGGWINR